MVFFFSSRRRHTRSLRDWSSDVCSSDLIGQKRSTVAQFVKVLEEQGDGRTLLADRDIDAIQLDVLVRLCVERRSEERRVGKECRSRWSPYPYTTKKRMRRTECVEYDVSM